MMVCPLSIYLISSVHVFIKNTHKSNTRFDLEKDVRQFFSSFFLSLKLWGSFFTLYRFITYVNYACMNLLRAPSYIYSSL